MSTGTLSSRGNHGYSNHLIPPKSRRQRRKSDPYFLKRPKRRNLFLPSLKKSASRDDISEYDDNNFGKSQHSRKSVDFNFGTNNDPRFRSLSHDNYMRKSSIHSNMSPAVSNTDLSRSGTPRNGSQRSSRSLKRKNIFTPKSKPFSILKSSANSSLSRLKNSGSNTPRPSHRSASPASIKTEIMRPQFSSRYKSQSQNEIYGSSNTSNTYATDRESWVEYSFVPKDNTDHGSQSATDFGYWQHKHSNKPLSIDSYVRREGDNNTQLPDLYSYNYRKNNSNSRRNFNNNQFNMSNSSNRLHNNTYGWNNTQHEETDTLTDDSIQPVRNTRAITFSQPSDQFNQHKISTNNSAMYSIGNDSSSLDSNQTDSSVLMGSYSKILPVGKFAHQKFHVNRSESDIGPHDPIIAELLADQRSPNSKSDIEFVTESVDIDISDYSQARITILIEIEKVFRQKSTKKWIRRFTNIERHIFIDLFSSGYLRNVRRMVSENLVETREREKRFGPNSRYSDELNQHISLSGGDFKLTGECAVKVYNYLMEIAENKMSRQSSLRSSVTKQKFTPRFLMASSNEIIHI